MDFIEAFVLRELTRPTGAEALELMHAALVTHFGGHEALLAEMIDSEPRERRIHRGSLTSPDIDTSAAMRNFIRSAGCDKYLDQPNRYYVEVLRCKSGQSSEDTSIALVFSRDGAADGQGTPADEKEVRGFLERGRRWENLGRTTAALQCYATGLQLHPHHPELLFRLGSGQMHLPNQLVAAFQALKEAYDMCPHRADYAAELGRCYLMIADQENVPIVGTPAEIRAQALTLLERAATLDPKDLSVAKDLASLRHHLGSEDSDVFFA